jgi:hypothetical protein
MLPRCVSAADFGLESSAWICFHVFDCAIIHRREVAYLFAGIFICIIPVMAMLEARAKGPFSPVIGLLTQADGMPDNAVYFWATGILSSFLDNAGRARSFFRSSRRSPGCS